MKYALVGIALLLIADMPIKDRTWHDIIVGILGLVSVSYGVWTMP
jgi:hypothetical protein